MHYSFLVDDVKCKADLDKELPGALLAELDQAVTVIEVLLLRHTSFAGVSHGR